jgi:hypothetical protein
LTLGEYVTALIDRLGESDPVALARMRQVTAGRRARIVLDDEAVDVAFDAASLRVEAAAVDAAVDGEGVTDRQTVLDLLDGYVEVTAAIREGRLRVKGGGDDIVRMFIALEILLDVAARTPSLQSLARAFRADPSREPPRGLAARLPRSAATPAAAAEGALLVRLDLLPKKG